MHGLSDLVKRKKMYHFLHDNGSDIIFLQELHSSKKSQKIWRSQWGGQMYFSHGQTNAQGVAIMLKKNIDCKVIKVTEPVQGRIIKMLIEYCEQKIMLMNVYAPNEQDTEFVEKMFQECENSDYDQVILGGDLNVTLDVKDKFPQENFKNNKKVRFCKHLFGRKRVGGCMESKSYRCNAILLVKEKAIINVKIRHVFGPFRHPGIDKEL